MNFSENEINFICRLLGIGRLLGYDTFPMLSKKESEDVVASFVEKKIIDGDLLTESGLALAQFIRLYTDSRRFLKIGNSMFANYQENEYVMITKQDHTFIVAPVNQDEIVVTLLTKFTDKLKIVESGKIKNKLVSKRSFKTYMDEHSDINAIFYYYIDLDKDKDRDAVLFYADNKLQHYNATLEELTIYPKEYVQKGIESIFSREVG